MNDSSPLIAKARSLKTVNDLIQAAVLTQTTLAGKAGAVRREMQAMAFAGESTGNPIHDHLIKNEQADDDVAYKRLRKIERSLKGKVGELIALLFIEEVLVRSDRPREFHPTILIGVIKDEHLIFADQKLNHDIQRSVASLPVTCYAGKHLSKWSVYQGRITEQFPYTSFEMTSEKRLKNTPLLKYKGYVLVGTKAVRSLAIPYQYGLQSEHLWGIGDPEKIFKDVGLLELDGS